MIAFVLVGLAVDVSFFAVNGPPEHRFALVSNADSVGSFVDEAALIVESAYVDCGLPEEADLFGGYT